MMRTHIGIGDALVEVHFYSGEDSYIVEKVMYKGTDIRECLSQDVLDNLCKDYLYVVEHEQRVQADSFNDYCF